MYTSLCRSLASLGYVVVALEHEDGSGVYASTVDGKTVEYKRPPDDTPYSRDTVTRFRGPMLRQRVREVGEVLRVFQPPPNSLSALELEQPDGELAKVLRVADRENISLVGHSFGATTAILAAQLLAEQHYSLLLVAGCDPWAFCLPDDMLEAQAKEGLPLFVTMSEEWARNKER